MNYKIYLDDIRSPKLDRENWSICRDVRQAQDMILEYGCPNYISFDYDLGKNAPTGYDFAKWLIEEHVSKNIRIPANFDFNVHSANPVNAKNISEYLKQYLSDYLFYEARN